MKRNYLFLILAASITLALSPLFIFQDTAPLLQDVPVKVSPWIEDQAPGEGNEDPLARFYWEQMRAADPATGLVPAGIRAKELQFASTLPVHSLNKAQSGYDTWIGRGPYNIGGRTRGIALDVNNENTILAGGATGGMWRSTDGGQSWVRTSAASSLKSVSCLVQDTRPGKTNRWYYGTGEYLGGYIVSGDGIFRSLDSGLTWEPLHFENKPQALQHTDYIWNLAINTANTTEDEIMMAAYGGIYRSTDGAESFTPVLGGGTDNASAGADIAITSGGVMYATLSSQGPQNGIWRSEDGVNWTNITPGGWPATYGRVTIGIAPTNENVVYFIANSPGYGFKGTTVNNRTDWNSFWKYTYVSGDGSDSTNIWEDRTGNLPNYNESEGLLFGDFNSQGGYDLVVKVSPSDENTVFIGGTCLYRSTDGFATRDNTAWIGGYNQATDVTQPYHYENHHPDQHNVVFLPSDPNVMISANDGGIYRTQDCMNSAVTWTSLNNGYINSQFYAVTLNKHQKHGHQFSEMILGGLQDNQSWSTPLHSMPNTEWTKWTRGDGGHCAVFDTDDATYVITTIQQGRIVLDKLSTDGTKLGNQRIDPTGAPNYIFITPFCLDAADPRILYHPAGDYIWRNNDLTAIPLNGTNSTISTNWQRLNNSKANAQIVSALTHTSTPASGSVLYYGTHLGRMYKLNNPGTGDPAKTEISSPEFEGSYIMRITTDPHDGNKVMMVVSNYNVKSIFYSADGGANWQDVSGNLEENPDGTGNGPSCRSTRIMHSINGETFYFVGTSTGLYMTQQLNGASTTWTQVAAESIGNTNVEMLDSRSDGLIVAATYGSGVFTANINPQAGINDDDKAHNTGLTAQAYPNPATTYTNLRLNIPEAGNVSVNLYDYTGKEILTRDYGRLSSGERTLSVPLNGLESGVYIWRVVSSEKEVVGKVMRD